MHTIRMTVDERNLVATNVVAITLRPLAPVPLPAWSPGAHIDLTLGPGLRRSYSLCGDPDDLDCYEIAVLDVPQGRGGSRRVHELEVGAMLDVTAPSNTFELVDAESYLFIAGGIGITPILPMVAEADRSGRPWTLYYGARDRAAMAFADALAIYGDPVNLVCEDEHGLLDIPRILKGTEEAETPPAIYCCGPAPLLKAVEDAHQSSTVEAPLYFERFSPLETHFGDLQAFEVQLGHDGPVLAVPETRSILDVLKQADVDVLYSCEQGTCGSCETQVLSGDVDHRDATLTDQDRADGRMLVCVSRARCPRLVLDLEPPEA